MSHLAQQTIGGGNAIHHICYSGTTGKGLSYATVKSNKGAFVCLCLRMWEAKMSQNVINYEMLLKSVRLKTETDIMCVGLANK